MFNKKNFVNVDNSDPDYPDGKIVNNNGSGNGTKLNFNMTTDVWEFFAKVLRKTGIIANNLPDNESNGFQTVEAMQLLPGKITTRGILTVADGEYHISIPIGHLGDNDTIVLIAEDDSLSTGTVLNGSDGATLNAYSLPFIVGDTLIFVKDDTVCELIQPITAKTYSRFVKAKGGTAIMGGSVDRDISATILGGTGFTVSRLTTGFYEITHNIGHTNYTITGSTNYELGGVVAFGEKLSNTTRVSTVYSSNGVSNDFAWDFIIHEFF